MGGQAQFAANIEALCDAGADVIVDDVYYVFEAAFQDDLVAQGVNAAVADGCVFISAGGNGGNLNDGTAGVWEGDYAAGASLTVNGVSVGVLHDFGGDVDENRITEDSQRGYVLQWSDPLEDSGNDYDLFLIDENDNVLDSSTGFQDGTQDPIEFISSSEDDHTDARLLIVKTAGATDRYLRLDTLEAQLAVATEGNVFGHAAAENAVSVAAVGVQSAGGSGGVFDGTESVRTSNSDGPRRIFFQPDGTPITAGNFSSTGGKLLQKPDLAAATCVSTSAPGFSPFCGVSAAPPHAAAITALMLEAAGGPDNVMPAALCTAMTGASLDIEATGVDRDSGAGIVMAPGAVDAVDVAVADRNGAPTVTAPLADRTIMLGAAVTVDVASAFSDPDNDTLTYKALSSDTDRVAVSLTGSQLTLTPVVPGLVEVTVRAADPNGLSVLRSFLVSVAVGNRDYDVDDDNLIEVGNLAQLDAVRYDLNGDGVVDAASEWQTYYAAFDQSSLMGCPGGCSGYELTASLDFDTNNSGGPDAGDTYWNGGEGWVPIGGDFSLAIGTLLLLRNPFTAIFEGNGHTVSNLFIDTDRTVLVGLFGYASSSIRNMGAIDVDVQGGNLAGGLIGFNSGEILASYVTGRVSGKENVGGLVGINRPTAEILASYATSRVSGEEDVGGLVGDNRGKITAGYATGRVSGKEGVGGLVGNNQSTGEILASYATGHVSGDSDVGGLVGSNEGAITVSYWDKRTSGHSAGSFGEGKTTVELQTPTGTSGIYQSWNLDLDSDQVNDWHFGTASQYPVLSMDVNGDQQVRWQEFGYQLREGPTLTAAAQPTQVALTWTAVTSHWSQAPDVTYTLYREEGATIETLAEGTGGLQYTDTDVTAAATYTYQVAAVVTGGEATRSTRVSVTVPGTIIPPPPQPPGGGGGGGGPRTSAPGIPRNLAAAGGDSEVVLTWDAPARDGGAAITDYEYRIDRRNPWISTGSTNTTHTVTGLANGTEYTFEVRAVNAAGKSFSSSRVEATPEAPEVFTLDFAHFANGTSITSDLVFVNLAPHPIRPAIYFYDTEGAPVSAESLVDVTGDLEITEDGGLTVQTEMELLGELTISTHGQGELVSGSVRVVSDGPIGGMLRYNLPAIGETVVGASPPVSDALFPVRRREGGINTGVAIHNLNEEAIGVSCRLMSGGAVLEEVEILLEANGQTSWLIDQAFPAADTSGFVGSVRCDAVGEGRFAAVALEMDPGTRIFTTLPLFPVDRGGGGREAALDFAHFANGDGTTCDLVFVNRKTEPSGPAPTPFHVAIPPIRPAIYFYDTEGAPIAAELVVDVTGDLEITEDGGLTVQTEMEPLGVLTISTHGQGALVTGSVRVVSDGPIGGMLRYDLPHVGEAVVGASTPVSDALFPVRRQERGITTGVAIHNLESSPGLVRCDLRREGVLLDTVPIPLAANGQTSWLIDQSFPAADTSDFTGSVRCDAVGEGLFNAVAPERFPFGPSVRPEAPLFPRKQPSPLRSVRKRSMARSGEADP